MESRFAATWLGAHSISQERDYYREQRRHFERIWQGEEGEYREAKPL
jgi:hypothetical protein